MSAKNESGTRTVIGPSVVMTASAGLTGILIALVVAGSILLAGMNGAQRGGSIGSGTNVGSNADYGLRHPGAAPADDPGYADYGLRHPGQSSSASEPQYLDYGLRHPDQR